MIWKLKIPLKIKIFLWFLQRGVVLKRIISLRKNGKGVKNTADVTVMRLSNISFWIALMREWFGG